MKNSTHYKPSKGEARSDLLRIIAEQIMNSEEEGTHVKFDRVNLEGVNLGSSMYVSPRETSEGSEPCNINIYVSNNIQGVNNSILVGSEVVMKDPGLGLSFGNVSWKRLNPERSEMNRNGRSSRLRLTFWLNVGLIFASSLAPSILFALLGSRRM